MRRHPVLWGLLLLTLIGILVFLLIYGILFWFDGNKNFYFGSRERIGVVRIDGVISDSEDIIAQLKEYEDDDSIRAIILRIDSPGGAVVPSQEIYDKVLQLKSKKSIVVSMGSFAASGGYYIACAADTIIANPGTITGSIGVIVQYSQVEELFRKIGLDFVVIKSGEYKDVGSPVRKMTSGEKRLIQGVTDDIYDQFLDAVCASRDIPRDKVGDIAEGKIFTGRQALALGLVDQLGNMESAIKLAAELAGIQGKPVVVYPKHDKIGFLRYFSQEIFSGAMKTLLDLHYRATYCYR